MVNSVQNNLLSIAPDKLLYIPYEEPNSGNQSSYKESLQLAISTDQPIAFPWSEDPKNGSVAIHYIEGVLRNKSWWNYSYQSFIEDIKTVEENDAFSAHLLIVDSPGGYTFGCHEAHEAIKNCTKPVIVYIESLCASAAYWLSSAADKIYASSILSEIGSIGVMATLINSDEAHKRYGYKAVELYATNSGRKNKVVTDATNGHPEEYIEKVLDPILDVMLNDITSSRFISENSTARNGEMYFSSAAQTEGLIDGVKTLDEVFAEIKSLTSVTNNIDINKLNLF